jgi:hypothetical protein
MTSPSERAEDNVTPAPYFDGEKWFYSKTTWRHSQQTKARAARKRREAELARLRGLSTDEAWIERVTVGEVER